MKNRLPKGIFYSQIAERVLSTLQSQERQEIRLKLKLLDRLDTSELNQLSDVQQLPDYKGHYALRTASDIMALFRYDENQTIYVFDIVSRRRGGVLTGLKKVLR